MDGLESVNNQPDREPRPAQAQRTTSPTSGPASSHGASAAGRAVPWEKINEALAQFDEETAPLSAWQPTLADKLLKNALILVNSREHRLAMNILRTLLSHESNHPDGLKWMGICLKEVGRLDEALKCFRALVSIRRTAHATFLLAETLYLLELDEDAYRAFHETLTLLKSESPIIFDIYKCLGNIHVRAGDYDAAEECYNKAYTLKPDSDTLMVNYGTLEIQRENLSAAVERFRRAVEINPENDKGWVGLALVHRSMGDLELGWANLERALDINPGNRTALKLAIEWGAQDRLFAVPIRRLKNFLVLEGEDVEMSFSLAKILAHTGAWNEAELEMERVLALDPAIPGGIALLNAIRAYASGSRVQS